MHKVVRPFPVSWDGLTLENLSVGDERDFGDMTEGLLTEGYIEPAESAPVAEPDPVPVVEPVVEPTATDVEPAPRRGRPRKA